MNVKVSTLGIVGLAVLSAAGLRAAVLLPDEIVAPEGVSVRIAESGVVSVRADGVPVEEVRLFWRRPLSERTRVFRDDWERTYAEAGWTTVRDNLGSAWYTMVHEDGRTDGYGVEVQPNALAWWTTATNGVTLTLDLRAGGAPLQLGARTLEAVRLVTRRGAAGESAFAAGRAFCRMMCPVSRLPKEPVYGYNDWYCAYGKNTATNFLADAGFIVGLCEGLESRPYVVMDDGWQRNSPPVVAPLNLGSSGWGPWDEAGEGFGMKMRPFAAAVAALGAKPGLWYRPFRAWEEIPDDMRLGANPLFFDPTHPDLAAMIGRDIRRFRDWGMKLVKIDYLTMDIADGCSFARKTGGRLVPPERVWRDSSRTTAEVLKGLYRTMREAAGDDMVIIGCNALNHLAAGLFEVQRTGGDTSGWKWRQTFEMGVNTLAARAMQDRIFFASDADCVGLAQAGAVPWKKNRLWLDLVSRSGTPLFVSWKQTLADESVRSALKAAYAVASRPRPVAEPLDWMETPRPRKWRFADGETTYDWETGNERLAALLGGDLDEALARAAAVEGDLSRLARVWTRTSRGLTNRIAVIGGSARMSNEKRLWANRLAEGWYRLFPDIEIELVDAGDFGGLPEVLSDKPDVVVIELSENPERADADSVCEEAVRRLLKASDDIAVLALGLTDGEGNGTPAGNVRIARHYGIPYISCSDAFAPYVQSGEIAWRDLLPDSVHPNDNGHELVASLVFRFLERRLRFWRTAGSPLSPIPLVPEPLLKQGVRH